MSNLPTFVPDELRLSSDDSYLLGVQQRQQNKIVPSQGSNGYRYEGTNQIEFNWSHGDATDLATTMLVFNWLATTGNNTTRDTAGSVSMASDVVDRVEFYIDSTEVLSSTNTQISTVQNILMFSEFPADYFEREGTMLMGHSSQLINPSHKTNDGTVGVTTQVAESSTSPATGRVFCVPLWALHNGFSQAKVCPVLGSNMRIVLHLNPPEKVLNTRASATSSYVLNNVYLLEDRLILTPDYKSSLMSAIRSEEGFKINFIDYDITAHNITGANVEHLVVRNDHSNALSLSLFNSYLPNWRADISGGNPAVDFAVQASYPNLDVDVAKRCENLKVECGNLRFTGLRGSESVAEHFSHLERANGSLAKASDTGCFDYYNYSSSKAGKLPLRNGGQISGHKNATVNFSPLVVSLEKTILGDTDSSIVNRGLNSTDPMASRDIEVSLQFPSGQQLDNQKERLFTAIIYEKALVMRNGQITIEH